MNNSRRTLDFDENEDDDDDDGEKNPRSRKKQRLYPTLKNLRQEEEEDDDEEGEDEEGSGSHSDDSESRDGSSDEVRRTIGAHNEHESITCTASNVKRRGHSQSTAETDENAQRKRTSRASQRSNSSQRRAVGDEVGSETFGDVYKQMWQKFSHWANVTRNRWRALHPFVKMALVFMIFFPLFVMAVISLSNNLNRGQIRRSSLPQLSARQSNALVNFNKEADELVRRHFHGDAQTRKVLRYAGEVMLLPRRVPSQTPIVFLAAGDEQQTANFIHHLRHLLLSKGRCEPKEYVIPFSVSKLEFETQINDLLSAGGSAGSGDEEVDPPQVLILKGIDRLKSTTPLVLQSISDPDSSPYKNVLIVVTLTPPPVNIKIANDENTENRSTDCDERISDHLLQEWNSELTPDKIQPILSRLSAIPLCLD